MVDLCRSPSPHLPALAHFSSFSHHFDMKIVDIMLLFFVLKPSKALWLCHVLKRKPKRFENDSGFLIAKNTTNSIVFITWQDTNHERKQLERKQYELNYAYLKTNILFCLRLITLSHVMNLVYPSPPFFFVYIGLNGNIQLQLFQSDHQFIKEWKVKLPKDWRMCDSCVITVYRQYFGYSISRSTNRNSPGPQICFDRRKVLKGVLTGTQEKGRRWATAPSRKWDKYVIFLLFCPQRCSFAQFCAPTKLQNVLRPASLGISYIFGASRKQLGGPQLESRKFSVQQQQQNWHE